MSEERKWTELERDLFNALKALLAAEVRYSERPESLVAVTQLDSAMTEARAALKRAQGEE